MDNACSHAVLGTTSRVGRVVPLGPDGAGPSYDANLNWQHTLRYMINDDFYSAEADVWLGSSAAFRI